MRKVKWMALLLVFSILVSGCEKSETETQENKKQEMQETVQEQEDACVTPFGRYQDTVTYTLGKMTGSDNSNLPEGETYENNAYTRYLKKKLNIQNKDVYEVEENNNFIETVSLSIINNDMPDVMLVNDEDILQELVEADKIEDLTSVYEKCASDRVKEIYQSYGEDILQNVTFDGKLMALPETNINNGPNLFWVRQDWLEKLGLAAPKTLEDVEEIVRAFIEKDPGNNGPGKTVGIACGEDVIGDGDYNSEYQLNTIFHCYDAYPKKWIENEEGDVEYGSVSREAKRALAKIRKWYQKGVIDKNFLLRGNENIVDMIVDGECGAFFGPWWAPNNPLMQAREKNTEAEWKPYLIQTNEDGSTTYVEETPSTKYVVVRKGYEHPEIVMKIVSVLFDEMKNGEEETSEIASYYQKNVDPTARPLAINVDYKDALTRCYKNLKDALTGKKDCTELTALEGSYYESCYRYQRSARMASAEDWASYISRITACSLLNEGKIKEVEVAFSGNPKSTGTTWWRLEKLEKEAYLKIITGQEDLSYFDKFVREWKEEGGREITKEVAEKIKK